MRTIGYQLAVLVLAAQAFAQTTFPRASGPYGPRAVGRPQWKVATLFELPGFLGWKVGGAARSFTGLTFSEAIVRVDKSELAFIEGWDQQWVSPEIRKNLDYRLTPAEVNIVKERLRKFRLQMPAYHVESFGDQAASRKVFEFAKGLGVETIVCGNVPRSLVEIDQLANEFAVNVALPAGASLEGRSRRIGVRVESPEAIAQFKDRVMVVGMRDPQSFQKALLEMYRLEIKPVFFSLMSAGGYDAAAGLSRAVDSFEQAVLPVLGDYMIRRSKTLAIRGPEELAADVKQKIAAAIPTSAGEARQAATPARAGPAHGPRAHSARELYARADRQIDRRVRSRFQQRPGESQVREDPPVRCSYVQ